MNKYKYTIIYQDCCSTKKIVETKSEFATIDEAKNDAKHFLEQNYPDMDTYHFQIKVEEEELF